MADMLRDQADGLRRLFARDFVRVITLASGRRGTGTTTALANLAAALAHRGKQVMVLDEHHGKGSVEALFGLKPQHDLMDVIRRERTLEEVLLQGPQGVEVVQAAQGLRALARLDPQDQEWLVDSFSQLPRPVDVILIDAIAGMGNSVPSLSLASQEVVVVVSGNPDSITDAYSLIKSLNRHFAKRRFHVLVNKVQNEEEARAVFGNMSQVAGRFLDVSLDFMGFVPRDELLRRAAQVCQPVADAFPAAESAQAFRDLAETVDQWPHPTGDNGRIGAFMQRLIQSSRLAAERFQSSAV